ncbi:hypothetical protein [Wolbachia endosymbiont of Tribolium confusum]|nr:hypothetical protein [Wolbachia endosymbiont of Tribolium confusum]MCA7010756.1 hypothetical protein [Wolbachia endosymbiont of Tribolium confusum]
MDRFEDTVQLGRMGLPETICFWRVIGMVVYQNRAMECQYVIWAAQCHPS